MTISYISGLKSSVVRVLAQNARGPGFESGLRLEFLPPVTYKRKAIFLWQLIEYLFVFISVRKTYQILI